MILFFVHPTWESRVIEASNQITGCQNGLIRATKEYIHVDTQLHQIEETSNAEC